MRLHPLSVVLAAALACAPVLAQNRGSRVPAPPAACVDFNRHANLAWQLAHPASTALPERSRLGDLVASAASQRQAMLEDVVRAPQNEGEKVLGLFWAAGIDEAGLERRSAAAVQAVLAPLAQLRRPRDLPRVVADFHASGIAPMAEFLRLEGPGDERPLAVVPAALGLADPAFYTSQDAEIRTLLGKYRTYVEAVLRASGLPEAEVSPASEAVLQIETQLAQAIAGEGPDARSADTLRAQDRRYIAFGFNQLLDRLGAESDRLVVVNPGYFATLTGIAADKDVQRMRWYLRFRVLNRLAPDLGAAFRTAHAGFFDQTLRGLPAGPGRAEHMDALLRRHLAGLADEAFNARNATTDHRQRAETVVSAVRDAAVALVGNTDPAAAATLAAARIDIAGSATPAFDTTGLELRADEHIGNLLRLTRWQEARVLAGLSTAIDPLPARLPAIRWIPATTTLAVSAAALKPPLLGDGGATAEARDFGALGALAGHELSKAIDAGSRGAGLGPLFNGLQAAPNLRVDGMRTLAMNRADLAGLEFAWTAFTKAQPQADANAKKAFFTGWAELWAKTQTTDALRAEVHTSPYAPAAFRVNATLAQLPAFAEAFACRAGQPMRAANPIAVWR